MLVWVCLLVCERARARVRARRVCACGGLSAALPRPASGCVRSCVRECVTERVCLRACARVCLCALLLLPCSSVVVVGVGVVV